ncbi:MAG: PAS domain-containing protein [Verrucomicrobiales bacterium]|nr:PAS domain-containing protein [Verrucomicrobiales bacterium]
MTRSKEKRILLGLALAFAVLVVGALILMGIATKQRETAAWAEQTRDILEKINELVADLIDAENGRRGYVLSGDQEHLRHHTNRLGHVMRALRELGELTKDNPRQSAASGQLEELIRQRLSISSNSIRARQENGLDLPAQKAFMEQGGQAMDPIRRLAARIATEENARLRERQAIQAQNVKGEERLAVLVSVLGLGLFATLFVLFARANRHRHRAEAVLQQTNLELEQRVQQRTTELSQSVEKIAWLASFPENNPNPIIELDLAKAAIHYANPYSIRMFPDLLSQGLRHPFLAGVPELAKALAGGGTDLLRREIVAGTSCYSQTISYVPEVQRLRVYSSDITERKCIEQTLAAERTLLRTLLDALPDVVFTKDTEGRFSMCNAAELRHAGLAREQELVGKSVFDLYPRELAEAYHADDLQALAGQPVLNREELGRDASGSPRWFLTTKVPLSDQAGRIVGIVGTSRDISERKQAEEALRESQERFRTLAESLPQLVWTCQPDGWCDYLSRQWVEYTGRPAEEQLGYGWAEHLHPDDRERVRAEWAKATERGDYFDIEFRIRRADGIYRWFKTRAVPLRDSSGHIVKWFGSNTDFEDYKRAERKLQTQLGRLDLLHRITRAIGERQDLRSIFQVVIGSLEDNLPVDFGCICLSERSTKTLTVASVGVRSAALARELALTEHTHVDIDRNGLTVCLRGQLVYEPDVTGVSLPLPESLGRGGMHSFVAAPLSVENQVFGILVCARIQPHAFSSADCEFLRQLSEHVALATHQIQLYAALQKAYDDLRQTQQAVMQQERLRALGQMASGIAHDINNAISPATLYLESLLETEPNLSSRNRECLETVQRAIEDVAQTVTRMREFYRQREPQLTLAPVQLNRLVEQVVDLTRACWSDMPQQHGIVIRARTQLAPDLPAIQGVESEIREAITNLVFNAVDAMPKGGTLTLRTKTIGGEADSTSSPGPWEVLLEVADTGVGMDEDTQRRCLEPFFTTKGERGTGLGLAMVYGVVQRHNAEIDVDSAVGQGTTVRLRFSVPAAALPEPIRPEQNPVVSSRLRILVVDDEPLLLKSLRDTLEGDGHGIVSANSAQEGIDTFRAAHNSDKPFAIVITDLGMPHADGREVARAVKELSPSTPVILLTGWGQRLVVEGDIPAHVDRVLSKPPKLRELREMLAHYCRPAPSPTPPSRNPAPGN